MAASTRKQATKQYMVAGYYRISQGSANNTRSLSPLHGMPPVAGADPIGFRCGTRASRFVGYGARNESSNPSLSGKAAMPNRSRELWSGRRSFSLCCC